MMKSENRMSKEAVKRRLNTIFGAYSDFYVKPSQCELANDGHEEPAAESSRNIVENNDRIENQDLPNGEIEEQRNEASIDNMIEIMDIPRPLSPVQNTPKEIKQEEDHQNKRESSPIDNTAKSLTDLEAIINQISVSPLLSPIRPDIFKAETNGCEPNRKRPNNEEEIVIPKKKKIKKAEEQRPQPSSLYSIKLGPTKFKKLLKKLDDQKPKKNGKLDDCAEKLPTNNKPPNNLVILAENSAPIETTKNGQLKAKISFMVPNKKSPSDYFPARARELRKKADNERDRVQQVLLCFESIAYYIMASSTLASKSEKMHPSIVENSNFLNSSWSSFKRHKMADSLDSIRIRLKYLQMMISACLAYQLYSIRSSQAFSAYSLLTLYEKENPVAASRRPASRTNGGSAGNESTGNSANGATTSTTTTSSPAASTPGSLNSQVVLPLEIYNALSAQNRTLHHLMWSFKLWNDAKNYPPDCKKFMDRLAELCGELKQNSELVNVAEYLLTAVYLLRQECNSQKEGERTST